VCRTVAWIKNHRDGLHQPIIFLVSYDDAGHPCDAGHPMLRYQDFQGLKLVAKDVLKVLY